VLDVANAAVNDLEAVGRGAGAEVFALDQRGTVAAQCGLARRRRAGGSAADDEHVMLTSREIREVSMHRFLSSTRRRFPGSATNVPDG
jgi:hypothetical protein